MFMILVPFDNHINLEQSKPIGVLFGFFHGRLSDQLVKGILDNQQVISETWKKIENGELDILI